MRRAMRLRTGCCVVLGWLAATPIAAGGGEAPRDLGEEGRQVVALVREHFFDAARAAAWAEANGRFAEAPGDPRSFREEIAGRLGRLGASHTGYYTPDDPEYHGLRAIFGEALGLEPAPLDSVGADFAPGGFVRRVFAGGPAEAAGLRRGDEVVSADGAGFHPVRSFRGRSGRAVTLGVRSRAGAEPRPIVVTPRAVDPGDEWLDAQRRGARRFEVAGKSIAYMPMFSCAGDRYREALGDAIAGEFAGADGLVLDFRDGWGGCSPDFVDLFSPLPPVLAQTGRDGVERRFDPRWRRPLVVLINGGSRSGKEVVAYAIRKHKLGKLVGERTAGAVLAGRCFPLAGGNLLYLAVADVTVDGARLEGKGVEPDVAVPDALPYAEGADPQLDRALRLAAE